MIALVRDENGDRASELANLTAPTLLLWGQDDFAYTPEREGAAFLEALPNATLEVLPGSGHYPIEDQPTAVTRLLEAHFEAVERQARESSPAAR
jgi:pimeloyl-ACP methyl ester carboxylesterase